MILGIGIDVIHLPRIQNLLTRKPTSLLHFSKRILSYGELKELKEFNDALLSNQRNHLEQDVFDYNVKFLAVR